MLSHFLLGSKLKPPSLAWSAVELLVKGTPGLTIMKGYFKDEDTTARTIQDGWMWTGDVAEVDEDGYFHFVDRAKDMIKRAGENVAAGEVEAVIKQHPCVADAAVIGLPDEERGELVCAIVSLKPGHAPPTIDDLRSFFINAGVMRQKIPERVEVMDEMPRNAAGKVAKQDLRDRFTAAR